MGGLTQTVHKERISLNLCCEHFKVSSSWSCIVL